MLVWGLLTPPLLLLLGVLVAMGQLECWLDRWIAAPPACPAASRPATATPGDPHSAATAPAAADQ
jgi:hypothetical protein